MSPFFPVFPPDTIIPKGYKEGEANYNSKSYWWKSERFHRKALKNMNAAILKIQPLIIDYEKNMISFVEDNSSKLSQKAIDKYFTQVQNLVKNWGSNLDKLLPVKTRWTYNYYWRKYNKRNGII